MEMFFPSWRSVLERIKMIVADTEDNSAEILADQISGFDKKLTQIAAITSKGRRFHNEGDPQEFLKWCHATGERDVWFFNTAYDIGNLCHVGSKLELFHFDVTMVKGRFIKGKLQGLNFYDVHNLSGAGSAVWTLGLAVDLPKLGHVYLKDDFLKFSPSRQAEILEFFGMTRDKYFAGLKLDRKLWEKYFMAKADVFRNKKYVFRDCEIPMRWLKFIHKQCGKMGIENIPATLGGLCTKAFKSMGHENWFEASDETSAALTGARVELFSGGGEGRIAYVDINSLYPWAMTQNFPEYIEPLDSLNGYGIADVTVKVPPMRIAPLPMKEENGRLIFPVGKFRGIWTIHEIKNAVSAGAEIIKIHSILGSPTGRPYYRDYITTNYDNRLKAKSPAENLFWKLLMNNLYGRLAIGGEVSRSLILTKENQSRGVPYGNKILVEHKMPLPEFTNYLHAAYVLSYGRIRLDSFLRKIPAEDLIYCDTDSVIFFCKGEIPFPTDKRLGEMKLESWGEFAEPYLPKTYVFRKSKDDITYKAKGVPKHKAKLFIETGMAEFDLPFKMREAIRFFDAKNSRKLSVWRKVKKIRHATYDRKQIKGKFFFPKSVNMV